MRVLVTGNAGFIGFHVARALLKRGDDVVGFDSVNSYYDPSLKEARLAVLGETAKDSAGDYTFIRANLADVDAVNTCFADHRFDRVIHLAAQAGIRRSIAAPREYVDSNLVGFFNIIEACRHASVPHLTYASSSSVYGANEQTPFSEHHGVSHPLQFYAATKRSNELMAHAYSHLYGLPTTAIRFFTVYGPWGRPDMALFKFTAAIASGEPISVFDNARQSRDFTFIDDARQAVISASDDPATADPDWDGHRPDPATSSAPFRIFNVGRGASASLDDYIGAIETALGRKAERIPLPAQPGEMRHTLADISEATATLGWRPTTAIVDGVSEFVRWYVANYGIK